MALAVLGLEPFQLLLALALWLLSVLTLLGLWTIWRDVRERLSRGPSATAKHLRWRSST